MEAEERPSKMRRLSHDGQHTVSQPLELAEASFTTNGPHHGNEADTSFGKPSGPYTRAKIEPDVEDVEKQTQFVPGNVVTLPPPEEIAPLDEPAFAQVSAEGSHAEDPPLSKNQQKKLRKKLEWEAKRDDRKVVRKEKLVAKRQRKRDARDEVRLENGEDISLPPAPPVRKHFAPKAAQLPITFLIDCDFDDLMRDNERISLAAQITRAYSDNKNSMFRAHLTICSFGGQLRERFDNVLGHYKGWRGVRFLDCDFVEASEKAKAWMLDDESGNKLAGALHHSAEMDEATHAKLKDDGEVVYLSSESDETLTELKPYSTYIIGGLVDKNREKGICYKRATQKGVRTARLPIGEFMDMTSRKVLATNHVNEIMLKWLECGDWGQAFLEVIPKRKGGKLKGVADDEAVDDGEQQWGGQNDGLAEPESGELLKRPANDAGEEIQDGEEQTDGQNVELAEPESVGGAALNSDGSTGNGLRE